MGKNVPKLRFKGFEGEWEEKRLGELGTFLKGNGISKSDLSESGEKCILYGELYTRYGEVIDKVYSRTNKKIAEPIKSKINDVILPSSGETAIDIATAACIQEDNILLGGDLNIFRSSKVNGIFTSYQLNNSKRKEIAKLAQGKSIVHIYNDQLKKIKLNLPSLQEQEKIANLLSKVDRYIELQEKKVSELEKYKKGMMQKIFSQKIRFRKDDGGEYPEWEEKRFKDIFDSFEYGMNSAAIEFDGENKYIRITDIDENSSKYRSDNIVSPDGVLEEKFLVKENDILFARTGASVGKTYLYNKNDGKLYFAGFLIRGHVNSNNDARFIFSTTQTADYKKWVKIMSMRSGQPGINSQEYASYKLRVPCLQEQMKIANFIYKIDILIENQNKRLEELKLWKRGLLQKMFV